MQTFSPSTGLPRLAAPICARASLGPGPSDDEELGSVAVAGQHAKRSNSVSHSIRTDVRVDEAQDVKKLRKGERQKKTTHVAHRQLPTGIRELRTVPTINCCR